MGIRVNDVITEAIKMVKAELKEYRATHDFCNPRNNGDLTPYQCSAKIAALTDLRKKLRKAKLIMLVMLALTSYASAAGVTATAKPTPEVTVVYGGQGIPSHEPEDSMSPCEKQMAAILKEMKRQSKPVEKKVYEYVLVAHQNETEVTREVNIYLHDGRWELFGSPTGDGKGYFGQALIRVKP